MGGTFERILILQHYAKFNSHTMAILENLLGVRSFNNIVGHLAHH
jgi:hypothetical protein